LHGILLVFRGILDARAFRLHFCHRGLPQQTAPRSPKTMYFST
jgi:hypothetical protein